MLLSEDHLAVQDAVRSYVQAEVAPHAAAWDKSHRFPAEALKGLDLSSGAAPSAEQLQKLQELSKTFDQAELQKASANIEAWVQENCSKS